MDVPYIDRLITSFQNELETDVSKWILENFNTNKTIEEMFQNLWKLEEAHRCLTPALIQAGKSNVTAEHFHQEGTRCLNQKNYDKALELFNLSIMTACHPSIIDCNNKDHINNNNLTSNKQYETLAQSYASRSEILFDLEQYDKSLTDIERAIHSGCSNSVQIKLEELKQKCIASRNKQINTNGDAHKEEHIDYNDVASMIMKCSQVPNEERTAKEILQSATQTRNLPSVEEANPSIPALSKALKLAYTSSKGRHLIAERDIQPGEVVGFEKSFSYGLYCDEFNTYCNTCLMECSNPVPCSNCSLVIFCSEACRDIGLSDIHQKECSILPTLATLERKENTVTYIAFRLILQTTYAGLQEKLPILQKETKEYDPMRLGFDNDGIYSSTDYRPVYHLVGNKNQRSNKELYETCVTAFALTKLLIIGGDFFKDKNGQHFSPTQEDFLMVGQNLFHHMLNIYCNAFQLSNMQITAAPVKPVLRVYGEGIFPALSLFNHSCNPNVRHYNHGNNLVLRAVNFIPAGGEVTTTYCGSFYIEDLKTRKEYLQNSYIDCTCEACLNKWPITNGLPRTMQVKCTSCGTPVSQVSNSPVCSSCKLDYSKSISDQEKGILVDRWWAIHDNLQENEKKVQYILMRKKAGQSLLKEDILILCNFIENVGKFVKLPCQSFCYAMDTLFLIFCLQFCSTKID